MPLGASVGVPEITFAVEELGLFSLPLLELFTLLIIAAPPAPANPIPENTKPILYSGPIRLGFCFSVRVEPVGYDVS